MKQLSKIMIVGIFGFAIAGCGVVSDDAEEAASVEQAAFTAITMTLRSGTNGLQVDPVVVTRAGGARFELSASQPPRRARLKDPAPPISPLLQPFACPPSKPDPAGQASTLSFDPAAIDAWTSWFDKNLAVLVTMIVQGQPDERLTVNLRRAAAQ